MQPQEEWWMGECFLDPRVFEPLHDKEFSFLVSNEVFRFELIVAPVKVTVCEL